HPQPGSDRSVIVDQQHPDRHRRSPASGNRAHTVHRPGARSVPASPPIARARVTMLPSPAPTRAPGAGAGAAAGTGLVAVIVTVSASPVMVSRTGAPGACRTALASISATIR